MGGTTYIHVRTYCTYIHTCANAHAHIHAHTNTRPPSCILAHEHLHMHTNREKKHIPLNAYNFPVGKMLI